MEKINIAELLKNCPSGMELDCNLFEGLEFDSIVDNEFLPIRCRVKNPIGGYNGYNFTKYGCWLDATFAKCVIFPKGKTTWEGFKPPCKFKDGDVVFTTLGSIAIISNKIDNKNYDTYCGLFGYSAFSVNVNVCPERHATEKEKQNLFQAIKTNGYKWNDETKSLEKSTVPSTHEKFYIRIGDIPSEERSAVHRGDSVVGYEDGVSVYDCVEIDELYRIIMPFPLKEGQGMTYECLIQEITQCRYEIENPRNVYLVSGIEVGKGHDNEPLIKEVKILKDLTGQFNTKSDNIEETKSLEKLVEPKFKVGDKIEKCGYRFTIAKVKDDYYITKCGNKIPIDNQDDFSLVPDKFDITTLKPFDKVLVRQSANGKWGIDFFGSYTEGFYYTTGSSMYVQCIPYDSNQHLLGTTNDCDEYYKTW